MSAKEAVEATWREVKDLEQQLEACQRMTKRVACQLEEAQRRWAILLSEAHPEASNELVIEVLESKDA